MHFYCDFIVSMDENKLEKITFSEISEDFSLYRVKNFIIGDNIYTKDICLDYPFSFEGVVFMQCLEGSEKIKISFREYEIEKDTIVIILPNQIVEKISSSAHYFVKITIFSPDFLTDMPFPKDFDLLGKITRNPVLKISEKDAQNLLRYYSFITETFNNRRHRLFEKVIKGLLFSLLMEIMNLYSENNDIQINDTNLSRSEEIAAHFISLLKDNYKERKTVTYYANEMFVTPKYLSSTLKKVTGRSISSWIDIAVIIGAKRMLKSTNLSVLQISEELNFPNPSYFGRFFKKKTGVTPKYYREN